MPLAALIAGLVAAHLMNEVPPFWALPALLVTTLAACFVRGSFTFLLSVSLLCFLWGAFSLGPFLRPVDRVGRFAGQAPVPIEGVVCRRPETDCYGSRLQLQAKRIGGSDAGSAVSGKLLVYVKKGRVQLYTGDRVLLLSRIRIPRGYGLPGEIDQARRLAYRGISATAFVMEADDIVLLRRGAGWLNRVDRLASRLGGTIMAAEPGAEGGVLKALLLGDKADVPELLQDAYARAGVNHILSISGFHVGIVFLTVFHCLYRAGRWSEMLALRLNLKLALQLAAFPAILFYLFLSGGAPATARSVLMVCAAVFALCLKREQDPLNGIALAACVILFAAPEILFEVSFQLSFLAIWGLAVVAPILARPAAGARGLARWLALMLAASAAAVAATFVPVAYYFQRVSLVGLVANLVVVPLMGYGAVVAGFASLPLRFLAEYPADLLLHAAACCIRWSNRVVLYLSRAPVLSTYVPDRVDLLLACLALCALTFLRPRLLRVAAAAVLCFALLVRAFPTEPAVNGPLTLYFLSVGQGDAALAHLPDGKWMLVDGGGNAADGAATVGPRLLEPALKHLGVERLDYLVLSHEHPDHLQGVLHVAARFEVGEFWESGVGSHTPEYLRLKWVLAARGVPVRVLNGSCQPTEAGGARIRPLWPPGAGEPQRGDANDSSLVFRIGHGAGSVIFTGDLGEKGEKALLERGEAIKSTILKVAHHGSRYSSCDGFLAAVDPAVAVISAGYGNSFRLPAATTLQRLQRHGIRVYRTDLEGTVQVVLHRDGKLAVSLPWGHFN